MTEINPNERVLLTIDNFRDEMGGGVFHLFHIARYLRGAKVGQTHGRFSYNGVMRMAANHRIKEVFADTEFSKDEPYLMANDVQDIVTGGRSTGRHAPDYLSVMMNAGPEALEAANRHKGRSKLILKANTPALSEEACKRIYGRGRNENVLEAGRIALEAGLDGVMCSSLSVGELRAMEASESDAEEKLVVIAAGIRMPYDPGFDPERHTTPYDALCAGADILAIGRSITAACDPEIQTERILASIS